MKFIIDRLMWPLYYAGVYAMVFAIRISSLWNEKSRLWLSGRLKWKEELAKIPPKKSKRIWFHVSSLGEYEQARPVIQEIVASKPATEIILSFFSPSGFQARKNKEQGYVIYLPADLPGNAENFIRQLKPDLAVFVKYDLWPGYLNALIKKQIPSLLISANWIPGKMHASWAFPLNHQLLLKFERIFFQRHHDLKYFQEKGFRNIEVAGDTRIDRTLDLPNEIEIRIPVNLKNVSYDLVAGSTWPSDEALIIHAIEKLNLRAIIAPHDVSVSNIERLKRSLPGKFDVLSELQSSSPSNPVLIIDTIGLLSVLYHLGKIAYVGGGFGKGIHNILEPASHARPVLFGPSSGMFPEAADLIKERSAFMVRDKNEIITTLKWMLQPGVSAEAGAKGYEYLKKHAGATGIVTKFILDHYLDR